MAAASRKNQFKVVLLGEGCVGKTSLMLRYVQDKFNDKHLTTLQVSALRFDTQHISCDYFKEFISLNVLDKKLLILDILTCF